MSSCLKEKSHKQGLQFLDIQDFPPIFEHVRMFFNQDIAPLYGDQTEALNKIFEGKDRTCEVLISPEDKEELGIIVHKDALTSEFSDLGFEQAFEIKTLVVVNPEKNSGKRVASYLLHRIGKKAVDLGADGVCVTVSSAKPESLAFFLKYGFVVKTLSRNHYVKGLDEFFLFHPAPEKLLNSVIFELLAERENHSTPIQKFSSDPIEFSTTETLLLKNYFQKNSRTEALKATSDYLGALISPMMLDQTLSNLRMHHLKWQSAIPSKHYTVLFINPLYETASRKTKIGYVFVGIKPNGKREILGVCLAALHQKCYWEDLFRDLRIQGIERVDVICGPQDFEIPNSVEELFPEVRVACSKALKSWVAENFIPFELGQELVDELKLLSKLCMKAESRQVLGATR